LGQEPSAARGKGRAFEHDDRDARSIAAERIGEQFCDMLADAIATHTAPGDRLSVALKPAVERAIRETVRSDPGFFVDILYPVIGPTIRRAISEALRGMVESLNRSLGLVFSWRYVRWRLEAARTGKPFAEVVLLHTLVYRVEQLFLLHRSSGLVLRHMSAEGVEVQDAAVVSAMLTAIQDFVHDSFGGAEGALESCRVGELGVWIEQGPRAVLAAVVRGHPPLELNVILRGQLERIELQLGPDLAAFSGDPEPFQCVDVLLQPCFVSARGNPSKTRQAL
jgi:OOP family OmpA-OmpF porin